MRPFQRDLCLFFFRIGQAPLLADGGHEVHDVLGVFLAHALAAVSDGLFHIEDFVLQGFRRAAFLDDFFVHLPVSTMMRRS